MISIVSLFVVVVLSLMVTRVGAVALRLTGMSSDAARFQARSALTGAGFTTVESEQVLGHPVRRRIISLLMVLGNIGLVAASGTLSVSLVGIEEEAALPRGGGLRPPQGIPHGHAELPGQGVGGLK